MSSPRKENGTTTTPNVPTVGPATKESHNESYQYVGPYRLEKTLGKGQTGQTPIIKKQDWFMTIFMYCKRRLVGLMLYLYSWQML